MAAAPTVIPPIDAQAFATALARPNATEHARELIDQFDTALADAFSPGADIAALVQARADSVDAALREIWNSIEPPEDMALVAVGGYGRGELHPASDIDILLLCAQAPNAAAINRIERFLALLWDIGLEIGHSVRTPTDCETEARNDVTVATALMEARLLAGNASLYEQMQSLLSPDRLWSARDFFKAKMKEQRERHARFDNTAYKLEPNIKEGPGGLRDIQNIAWVAKRHFNAGSLDDLVRHDFLTPEEGDKLLAGRAFLWQIRFALHVLYGRREERLLFDAQLKLARQFGYDDAENGPAVEQFMQRYYRMVMDLSRLNEMLLELFEEEILLDRNDEPAALNRRFQVRNGFLEITDDEVFRREPGALLELFHLLQQNPDIKGVSPSTIRRVRRDRELVDAAFRSNPDNRAMFMRILCEPQGVTHEFRRMNRYGILERYIPAFGRIVGRMQFDLFHAYTVDEHTLTVLSNLRRFALPRFDHEFPACSKLMQSLPKPELAYLAGLFHDIAKGRGGDHSELGAEDAETFCLEHELSRYDARLVAWLVRNHLLLSVTAQKQDIADPDVIHEFANKVGDQLHLDYLYLLTVADVRGTNPDLWNSWKARLFRDLYEATRRALNQGLENPLDREELIKETKDTAIALLASRAVNTDAALNLWQGLNDEYFLRHQPGEIAWHTAALLAAKPNRTLLDLKRDNENSGTAIFLSGVDDGSLFGRATAALEQLGLTIMEARIVTVGENQVMQTYTILEADGSTIEGEERERQILQALRRRLDEDTRDPMRVTRRTPRQMRFFTTQPRISFSFDARNRRNVMEVIAQDMPGLLSRIGATFNTQHVKLQNAKIATVGERAEDVFFLTAENGRPLDEARQEQLRSALLERLTPNS